jgi:hypothetical protein
MQRPHCHGWPMRVDGLEWFSRRVALCLAQLSYSLIILIVTALWRRGWFLNLSPPHFYYGIASRGHLS